MRQIPAVWRAVEFNRNRLEPKVREVGREKYPPEDKYNVLNVNNEKPNWRDSNTGSDSGLHYHFTAAASNYFYAVS